MKTYKFRLAPTRQQEQTLAQSFGNIRFVYNKALATWNERYEAGDKDMNYYKIAKELKKWKHEYEWLKISGSQTLQQSLKNLDKAFKNFFKKRAKHPQFHSKYHKQSIHYPQFTSIDIDKGIIKLPKKLNIKCKFHRDVVGNIKSMTITKTATGKYFVSILTDHVQEKPNCTGSVGIDVGIKSFAVLSNGIVINNPHHLKNSIENLKQKQRWLSRKKKGGANYKKQRLIVAKLHEKVSNQREAFLHQVSIAIATSYHTIYREDLNIKGMLKNHKLAQSIADVGWGMFYAMLNYKCNKVVKIDRWAKSSKQCSRCGNIKQNLKLNNRVYECSECGLELDRDLNASINIKRFGSSEILVNLEGLDTAGTVGINACGDGTIVPSLKQEAQPSLVVV